MTKANSIELRRAHSGRLYLTFYDESEDTFILGDDGCSVKVPRDIVESLELVDILHTMKEIEYFSKNRWKDRDDTVWRIKEANMTKANRIELRRAHKGRL